jgi:hypothetical protein
MARRVGAEDGATLHNPGAASEPVGLRGGTEFPSSQAPHRHRLRQRSRAGKHCRQPRHRWHGPDLHRRHGHPGRVVDAVPVPEAQLPGRAIPEGEPGCRRSAGRPVPGARAVPGAVDQLPPGRARQPRCHAQPLRYQRHLQPDRISDTNLQPLYRAAQSQLHAGCPRRDAACCRSGARADRSHALPTDRHLRDLEQQCGNHRRAGGVAPRADRRHRALAGDTTPDHRHRAAAARARHRERCRPPRRCRRSRSSWGKHAMR